MDETRNQIKETGLIAILRGDFPLEQMLTIGQALQEGGLPVMEVTLNSSGALRAIAALRRQFEGSELLVGAGTVRSAEQVEAAVGAGAQFIVSPNFEPEAVACSQAAGVLHLPGVFTPSEAHNAFAAGCRMLKLFPADALGPAYLKALRAPLDDIEFVPTGGISAANLTDYVRAGAVAFGIGSALITRQPQSKTEIIRRAKSLRRAWEESHHGRITV